MLGASFVVAIFRRGLIWRMLATAEHKTVSERKAKQDRSCNDRKRPDQRTVEIQSLHAGLLSRRMPAGVSGSGFRFRLFAAESDHGAYLAQRELHGLRIVQFFGVGRAPCDAAADDRFQFALRRVAIDIGVIG